MVDKIKVLLVDDAAFTRDLVKKGVRSHFPSFALTEAGNGRQAQNKLADGGYDLVLCDWEMPEMGGDELLEWMRANDATRDTPFVMITSRGEKEHVVKAVELGVSNYIVKPFTTEKLVNIITTVLSKAKGVSPEALLEKGSGPGGPPTGNDSASVLTAGPSQRSGGSRAGGAFGGDLPVAENVSASSSTPQRVRPKQKIIAQMRFAGQTSSCLVKQLDHNEAMVVIKRGETLPTILDAATFDFDTDNGNEVSRINAYIHALQAREAGQESEFVNVTLRFIDDDPTKTDHLSRYMAAIAD